MRTTLGRAAAVASTVAALLLSGCGAPAVAPTSVTPSPSATSVTPSATSSPAVPSASATPAPAAPSASPTRPSSASHAPDATPSACPPSTGASILRAPGTGKTVALTFDDGPGPFTRPVLEALDRAGVKATFFMTGAHAAANPALVAEVESRGDLVEDHTWDHRYPSQVKGGWTTSYLTDQVERTASFLTGATGRPVCFFRPPGGFLDSVPAVARSTRLSVVLWSVDTKDWQQPGSTTDAATAAIVAAATDVGDQAHPIVLLHDSKASHEPDSRVSPNRSNTVAALPAIIAWYAGHGYRFVRLDGAG